VKWRLIPVNPAAAVDPPSPARGEMRTFDAQQATAVLEVAAAEGVRWQAFFAVAMTTGLRLGELIGLRWQDVDLTRGTLAVRRTIQRLPKVGVMVKEPKTAGSRRPVALGADVIALLGQHRAAQDEVRRALGTAWQEGDLVFPGDDGSPIGYWPTRQAFGRICARAGDAADPAPRPAAHRGDAAAHRWHPPKGGERAARARLGRDHPPDIFPRQRDPPAGGRLGAGRPPAPAGTPESTGMVIVEGDDRWWSADALVIR